MAGGSARCTGRPGTSARPEGRRRPRALGMASGTQTHSPSVLPSVVRIFVAAMMLLLQFEPVFGFALCDLIRGADPGRMEADCPTPDAREGSRDSGLPGIGGVGGEQDCILAAACGHRPPAVRTASDTFVPVTTDFDRLSLPLDAIMPSAFPSPPVPPPRRMA